MDIRSLEKSKKFGYLFFISYSGKDFQCFDDMAGKKSVKGTFKEILLSLGVSWSKGVQQAGRTDAGVSARGNILYISSNFNGDLERLRNDFNNISSELKIEKIEKTFSDLVIPDLIKGREYHYYYPKDKIKRDIGEINGVCSELSGTYDVSEFTDFKGKLLKEKIRTVDVSYDGEKLVFKGNSFMPKQVRIMCGYILGGEKKIFPAKYLELNKVILSKELEESIFEKIYDINEDNVVEVEKVASMYIFYVLKEKKGEFIGKRGKNIRRLRKKYGDIVVRTID